MKVIDIDGSNKEAVTAFADALLDFWKQEARREFEGDKEDEEDEEGNWLSEEDWLEREYD